MCTCTPILRHHQWSEPDDARRPERGWRLYVFKSGELKDTLHLHRQSAYLIGRHDVADLKVRYTLLVWCWVLCPPCVCPRSVKGRPPPAPFPPPPL